MAQNINFGSEADQLRRQLAEIQNRSRLVGRMSSADMARQQDILQRLNQARLNQASTSGGGVGNIDPNAERDAMFAQTEGRATSIETDPQIAMALQAYQDVLSGQGLPFSDETVGRMQGQVADMNAAGAAAQQARLREQMAASGLGGPSADAASRSIDEQRALANQDSMRQMLIQQSMQNYEARQRAAQALAGTRMGQFGLTNPLAMQAAQYHSQSYDEPRVAPQSFQVPAPRMQQPQQQQQAGGYGLPAMNHNYQVDYNYGKTPPPPPPAPRPQPGPSPQLTPEIMSQYTAQYGAQGTPPGWSPTPPAPATAPQGWQPGMGQPTVEQWQQYQNAQPNQYLSKQMQVNRPAPKQAASNLPSFGQFYRR